MSPLRYSLTVLLTLLLCAPALAARMSACGALLGGQLSTEMRVVSVRQKLQLRVPRAARGRSDLQQSPFDHLSIVIETLRVEAPTDGRWVEVEGQVRLLVQDSDGGEQVLQSMMMLSRDSAFNVVFATRMHLNSEVKDRLSISGREYLDFGISLTRPLSEVDEWQAMVSVASESDSTRHFAYDATVEAQHLTVIDYLDDGTIHTMIHEDPREDMQDELLEDITDELDELSIPPPPHPRSSASRVNQRPRED